MTDHSRNLLTDHVAEAFLLSMSLFAGHGPGRGLSFDELGVGSLTSPTANGVLASHRDPDPLSIRRAGLPFLAAGGAWSIEVRGEATAEMKSVAAGLGLVQISTQPMFFCERVPVISSAKQDAEITSLDSSRRGEFVTALAEGYGAPEDVMASFTTAKVLDHASVRAYASEESGAILATALSTLNGGLLGLFSVSTRKAGRRQGRGRSLSERALADGFSAGAHGAYLRSSDMAKSLYESLRFTPIELWTRFS